jgi:hypothetical protein
MTAIIVKTEQKSTKQLYTRSGLLLNDIIKQEREHFGADSYEVELCSDVICSYAKIYAY